MSVQEAIQVLETAGYYVGNLWHINDVVSHKKMSNIEALNILDDSLNNDWIIAQINDSILEFINEKDG